MLSVSDSPPLSVTWAVMVCVPTERLDNENKLSVAKNPSMLEVHWMKLLSEPCSGSLAEPENVTDVPSVNEEPEAGDDIDTVGGEFAGSLTVIDMLSVSDSPPLSVTWAVMAYFHPTHHPQYRSSPHHLALNLLKAPL